MIKKQPSLNQEGFTIIELLIATAVLSTILVLTTIMMTSIGRLYYKGINQAKMQQNVRAVTDDISEQLKLNNAPVDHQFTNPTTQNPAEPQAWCIGSTRYTYVEHVQPGGVGGYQHILWRDTIPGSTCQVANLKSTNPSLGTGGINGTGAELISTRSRLSHLTITRPTPASFNVSIGLAYGDDDLFEGPTLNTDNPKCLNLQGSEFCATATLSTRVLQRVTN